MEADGQRGGALRRRTHPPPECLGRGEQRHGVLQQLPTGRREHRAAPVTVEDRGAEFVLQAPDLTGQDRLGDVQPLGRASEVELFGHGHEIAELPQIKIHPDSPLTLLQATTRPGSRPS
ncbi:hypothetical protein RKD25_007734 [Streptomyces sp. SAI-124]